MSSLAGRRVVLGVCGGIAAYKAVEVCRRLVDAGAHVVPVMTAGASRFIGETTLSALASEPLSFLAIAKTVRWACPPKPQAKVGGWRTTRVETRYGCFLPDLTGLARDSPDTNLPGKLYQDPMGRTQVLMHCDGGTGMQISAPISCGKRRANGGT